MLDLYLFKNLKHVSKITEDWLEMYNTERPHEALNNMTPIEYRNMNQIACFSNWFVCIQWGIYTILEDRYK